MFEVMKLIRERKWDSLVTWALLIIVGVTVPIAVGVQFERIIDPIVERIEQMESRELSELTQRAIAAYGIINTIEDLQVNPNNRINIYLGLQVDSIRTILFEIDRDRTLLFEDYFRRNNA